MGVSSSGPKGLASSWRSTRSITCLVELRKDLAEPQCAQAAAIHLMGILGVPKKDEEDNDFQKGNVVDVHADTRDRS